MDAPRAVGPGNRSPGAALLDFVAGTRYEELPKPALEMARLAVLDWWGVTVAGADEPVSRLLRGLVVDEAPGPATVLGTGRTASPMTAALLNGTAGHALDYDDVSIAMPGHPSVPLLPGLVALGEARGLSGRNVLTAFVLGVEVICRVSQALFPGHYRAGWHATATIGRLAGAAAAARLLGLDAAGVDRAVGLGLAQLGGVQEAFGTMAKPFQVGRAAADAVLAALGAEAGMTAPRAILDGEGWARRLSPDWVPARLADGLGRRYAVTEILFKRYPCCFATHAAITGLLRLAPRIGTAAVDVVELEVCPTTLQVADQREPRTGLAGKFSMTYCAAAALVRGRLVEEDFTDATVADPRVVALARRVRLTVGTGLDETRARVAVRLSGGREHEGAVDLRAEEDLEGLTRDLREKFRHLVAPRLGADHAARLIETIARLEEVEDVMILTGTRFCAAQHR
jgi:2-methylcitrate dehydratase PrpD